jgi:hypothetical protein
MNLLGGTMPEHGMSREEADELVRDLSAAGIEVVRVDELRDGSFAPYYVLPHPTYGGWITNARRWRESVRAGLIEGVSRDALP